VIRDTAGNLYGTTRNGGSYGAGVVFKIDTAGTESVLYSLTGGPSGASPAAGLILDASGNLYGTAGNVFKLDTSNRETVLHTFKTSPLMVDGSSPGELILGPAGNLFGITSTGGPSSQGILFQLQP